MTRQNLPTPPLGARIVMCACLKWYSPTKNDARALRHEVEQHTGSTNPVRYYTCDHGGWHWTRQIENRKRP